MYLGVDYYPEHWNEDMLEEDLNNIVELGSNVIRIGEFAWHMMEKEEGLFDFSYHDTFSVSYRVYHAPLARQRSCSCRSLCTLYGVYLANLCGF